MKPQLKFPLSFWAKVNIKESESECWEWKAFRDSNGYGRFKWRDKSWLAHRLAWQLYYEADIGGLVIGHHCDNPACVSPFHLFLGTQTDNLEDMHQKRRHNFGEKVPQSKLTSETVREIRRLFASGKFQHNELGLMFGVCRQQISRVVRGIDWRHV